MSDVRGFVDQSAALGTISSRAFTESLHNLNNRVHSSLDRTMDSMGDTEVCHPTPIMSDIILTKAPFVSPILLYCGG